MEENNSSIFKTNIDFFGILRRCWAYMILAALVFGLGAALYTTFMVNEVYSSTVEFFVQASDEKSTTIQLNTELDTAENLIDSYTVVIKRRAALWEKIAEEADVNLTPSQLRSMVSVSHLGGSFLAVKITSSDPHVAHKVAVAVEKVAPDEITKFTEAGNIEVMNSPLLSLVPESPNLEKNVVIAAFIGAILVFVAFGLFDVFDTRVLSEEDLQEFEISVLGSIPQMSSELSSKKKNVKKG